MSNRRLFQLGLALTLLSLVGLGVSLPWLVSKLRVRNVTTMRLVAQFEAHSFEINGEPFRVERVPPLEEGRRESDVGDPDAALRVHWRGRTHDFQLGPNNSPFEPGLRKYALWFGVLLLADGAATEEQFEQMWSENAAGAPEFHFVAAARYPAAGYDPETWGNVRRQEWVYEFARFNLEGPPEEAIEVERKLYEQVDALLLPGKYTDEAFLPTPQEREEDLWQYYAMDQVTPPGQIRGRNKVIDTLMRELGLAWPAAGSSMLGLVIGVLLMAMSRRERADDPIS